MSTAPSAKPKKKRRLAQVVQNVKDSYTISRRSYPWIGWALLGIAVALLVLAGVLAAVTSQALWYWLLMAVIIALMVDMVVLSLATRRASYMQIEGRPGAVKAVLDQSGRGWYVESDPVAFSPRGQDFVWRLVGRPGVVLVAEGSPHRTQRMIEDEQKVLRRILSTVPVHVISVGTEEGQTRLIHLERTLRRLPTKPTKLTNTEIDRVAKRLSSLSSKGMPIPKHMDPNNIRPDRRAMRGR
ncbi:DUF4191 domain-containing protein [Actinomyces sp. MRS3W]|uniref:DUF4191 domain-containing protein n=1 Tax=Actinomyces sp. MRS3W TaxID=2800796 RepID=UPI0028FD5510|nr:DUF4191 domain-containing protein [Actinomyces sp. MRS3W]MDU0348949.1 DUF4191 domain-containing protein [Actinomyces sp. MRS3W]